MVKKHNMSEKSSSLRFQTVELFQKLVIRITCSNGILTTQFVIIILEGVKILRKTAIAL